MFLCSLRNGEDVIVAIKVEFLHERRRGILYTKWCEQGGGLYVVGVTPVQAVSPSVATQHSFHRGQTC